MSWININDFKPDQRSDNAGDNVLCYGIKWSNTYIAQYVNGRFKFPKGSQAEADTITHWMPLPYPPRIFVVFGE